MKKLTLGAIALSVAATTSIYATLGTNLIGTGAIARGMGGAGIAIGYGAESTLVNPATITSVKGTEISFGGTIFMPNVKADVGPSGTKSKSASDLSLIPAVAIAHNLGNNLYLGIGMYGTAGMGVDYRKATNPGLMSMETTLQLMQFVMPIAYKYGGLSVAVAPILQYGSLDVRYTAPAPIGNVGYGQVQDLGYGFSVGATYDFGNGFSIGAIYNSKIKMKYTGALSTATQPFVMMGAFPAAMADNLDQPAVIGVGVAYKNGPHTVALDYKKIKWSSAAGYKDFGWKDQNVISLGYEYNAGTWAIRGGYVYAKSPVPTMPGTTPAGQALNGFNLIGFPATVKTHVSLGGSYKVSDKLNVDLAVVYAPKQSVSATGMGGAPIVVDHSQTGVTVQLDYKF